MPEPKKRTTRPAAERAISLDLPITMTAKPDSKGIEFA